MNKQFRNSIALAAFACITLSELPAYALPSEVLDAPIAAGRQIEEAIPLEIEQLYADLAGAPLARRIEAFSNVLLGKRYLLEALGEGDQGRYDRDPLFRFDAFDCTTYVETVLALSKAQSSQEFPEVLRQIRYRNGVISFLDRNHFPETDWIPNNIKAGFFREATHQIANPLPVLDARTTIDKRGWVHHLTPQAIQVPAATEPEKQRLLQDLQRETDAIEPEPAITPYLSLRDIFAAKEVLGRIPSGSIINIVRPDWDVEKDLGTRLNISHQAWVIQKNGIPMMRHASSSSGKVVEVPLEQELARYLNSPTIRGIEILVPEN